MHTCTYGSTHAYTHSFLSLPPHPSLLQGIYTLFHYIRSRMITISVEDIKILLTQENPYLNKLEDDAHQQAKKIGTVVLFVFP